jgi:hypothetical protein
LTRVARSGLGILLAASAFVLLSSCRREAPDNIDRNKAPETYITKAPAESTSTYYRVRFYWSGLDVDGQIAYYEIAVTDSNQVPGQNLEEGTGYTRTLKTDSLFVLRADPPVETQIIGKRFYVRAVDNEGKVDPTPARAYFESRNDFYPEVVFNPGSGNWIDKCGLQRTRVVMSTERSAPTDTVGAGATMHWSWGGRDGDPEGSISGYEYKLGTQPLYQRGGPADTTLDVTFPLNSSRVQILQVRAIDDGGLRSSDDYIQSVVVNFDPITRIVDPVENDGQGNPVSRNVFTWGTLVLPSGTTLPDNRQDVTVTYTGLDDPRDFGTSCASPNLSRYQSRVPFRDDSEGNFTTPNWTNLSSNDPFPVRNSAQVFGMISGDHLILIRAIDVQQIVDSTPETVLVKVNYRPYLTEWTVRATSAPEAEAIDLLAAPPGQRIDILVPEGDSLFVTMVGSDLHLLPPNQHPLDPNTVIAPETGALAGNGYRVFYDSSVFEPSFEPTPPDGVPFTYVLPVPDAAVDDLIADLRDRTFTNPNGRLGRTIRSIRIVR